MDKPNQITVKIRTTQRAAVERFEPRDNWSRIIHSCLVRVQLLPFRRREIGLRTPRPSQTFFHLGYATRSSILPLPIKSEQFEDELFEPAEKARSARQPAWKLRVQPTCDAGPDDRKVG